MSQSAAKKSTSSAPGKPANSTKQLSAANWRSVTRFVETAIRSEAMLVAVDLDSVLLYHEPADGDYRLGRVLPLGLKLCKLLKSRGYQVVVLTARKGLYNHGRIFEHLRSRGFPVDRVTNRKPPADAYFDDKAFRVPKNWAF
jgi:hypothetical protein